MIETATSIDSLAGGYRTLDSRPELKQQATASPTFARLRRDARTLEIGGRTFYILEGDLLLDEVQLAEHALRKDVGDDHVVAQVPTNEGPAKLLGISRNGKILRWRPGTVLAYYIAKESFPTPAMYETVRDRTRAATEEWMNACGIAFDYRGALDDDPTDRASALFGVFHVDVHGRFIAAAFFPDDPVARRMVIIDPSYFDLGLRFDRTGVLRHELGHVLGFRHEHIRSEAPAVCQGEPLFDTVPLGAYDPQSVMHYFCGGVGSAELAITELDRTGAQRLYGAPASAFLDVG